jgi:chorismate synthase
VPSCSIVAESMLAWVIAKFFLEKFGGDSFEETKENFNNFNKNFIKRTKRNFAKR